MLSYSRKLLFIIYETNIRTDSLEMFEGLTGLKAPQKPLESKHTGHGKAVPCTYSFEISAFRSSLPCSGSMRFQVPSASCRKRSRLCT